MNFNIFVANDQAKQTINNGGTINHGTINQGGTVNNGGTINSGGEGASKPWVLIVVALITAVGAAAATLLSSEHGQKLLGLTESAPASAGTKKGASPVPSEELNREVPQPAALSAPQAQAE